jgi:hypothetical protein
MMKKPWSIASCQAVAPTAASVMVSVTRPSIRNFRDSALVLVRFTITE